MLFDNPVDVEKTKKQSYTELFKERGLKCACYNAAITCACFFVSPTTSLVWEYGVFFFISTLLDTLFPKFIANYKSKQSEKNDKRD